MTTHELALVNEGWTRRFIVAPTRLDEFVQLYRSLGYEVRLEKPEAEELRAECGGCIAAMMLFRTLYTRRPA